MAQVQSQIGELRPCTPYSVAQKKKILRKKPGVGKFQNSLSRFRCQGETVCLLSWVLCPLWGQGTLRRGSLSKAESAKKELGRALLGVRISRGCIVKVLRFLSADSCYDSCRRLRVGCLDPKARIQGLPWWSSG